jgi:hypothetical protein
MVGDISSSKMKRITDDVHLPLEAWLRMRAPIWV